MSKLRSISVYAAITALLAGCSATTPEPAPPEPTDTTANTPHNSNDGETSTTEGAGIETMIVGTWSCLNSSDVGPAFDQWGKGYEHIRDDAEMTFTDNEFVITHDDQEATGTWALADGSLTLTASVFPEAWGGPSKTWTIGNFPMTVEEAQSGAFLTTDAEGEDYQKVSLTAYGDDSVTVEDTEGRTSTCRRT